MSGWETKQIGHFPEYEMVRIDNILGKECTILRCERDVLTTEKGEVPVVHFLVHFIKENATYEIRTGAYAIVKTVENMRQSEIDEMIRNGEKTMFTREKTLGGNFTYKMV